MQPVSKDKTLNMNSWISLFALASITLGSSQVFASAARIQFVAGEVKILNVKQIERLAQKGGLLDQGDTVITGADGTMQMLMDDGGMIAVRPDTRMKIDVFKYSGKPDENSKSFFSLAKGTFRSVTGAIGKANRQSYKVTTPDATIGIRGTVHQPTVVLPALPGLEAQAGFNQVAPGTYDKVDTGEIYIQNGKGTVVVSPNEVGFAARGGIIPVILPNIPPFYNNTPKPTAPLTVQPVASTSQETLTVLSDSLAASTTTSSSGTSVPVSSSTTTLGFTPAPIGSGVVGADTWRDANGNIKIGAGGMYMDGDPAKQMLLGLNNELILANDTSNGRSFQFSAATGTLVEAKSLSTAAGTVYWGRWEKGFTVYDQGVLKDSLGSFHYMYAPNITPYSTVQAMTGSASYSFAGGTAPTDQNGVAGKITSASLSANFTNQQVTFNVATLIAGYAMSGGVTGSISSLYKDGVKWTGLSGAPSGQVNGMFVGPDASGAITSFNLYNSSGTATGTAVFVK